MGLFFILCQTMVRDFHMGNNCLVLFFILCQTMVSDFHMENNCLVLFFILCQTMVRDFHMENNCLVLFFILCQTMVRDFHMGNNCLVLTVLCTEPDSGQGFSTICECLLLFIFLINTIRDCIDSRAIMICTYLNFDCDSQLSLSTKK